MDEIQKTKEWIESIVIGLNLCPFAKKPFEAGLIHYALFEKPRLEELKEFFNEEVKRLDQNKAHVISTSFIVFSNLEMNFYDFFELTQELENILTIQKKSHRYQVVAFHPEFQFEGEIPEARINLVNRSPYPMIHLLRCVEVKQAVSTVQAGESISYNNEQKLESMSEDEIAKIISHI